MTLSQIQYFLTAARCLSFTTAAKELYMSQPALGRQISAMEDELGVKLFVRSKNSLMLTPVGNVLRDEFNYLMMQYNGILQKVHAMGSENSVLIKIGILEGYGLGDILPQFLKTCREEHSHLMVDLIPMSYSQLHQGLLSNELDFVLTFKHDIQDKPDILFREMVDIPMYLAYHKDVVEQHREGRPQYDIWNQLFIFDSPEDSSAVFSMELASCEKMGVTPRYKMVSGVNTQLFYVRQGYGCGLFAGNCNLRTDPAIIFEPRPELDKATLVGAWNIHAVNPGIQLCLDVLDKLMDQSDEVKKW